jgi:Fur family transcriptional regulator, ferric uptake regulator
MRRPVRELPGPCVAGGTSSHGASSHGAPSYDGCRVRIGTTRTADDGSRSPTEGSRAWARTRLREIGLTPTRPRVLVLAALREHDRDRPVTARELHSDLHGDLADGRRNAERQTGAPGLTTVYRALASLCERGVLHSFHPGGPETSYRLCGSAAGHGHLMCRCCGRVQEHPLGALPSALTEIAAQAAFALEGFDANLTGLCANCRPTT